MRRLKLLRLNQRKTQWEVGRAAGFSQGRYSMIERGLIEPTPAERERLAAVLAIHIKRPLPHSCREAGR